MELILEDFGRKVDFRGYSQIFVVVNKRNIHNVLKLFNLYSLEAYFYDLDNVKLQRMNTPKKEGISKTKSNTKKI